MKKLAICLLVLSVSACGGLLPKGAPAPDVYTLNAPQFVQNAQAPLPYAIEITLPQVTPGLNTDRIALRTGSNQIDYYAGSRWGGELTAVVQAALTDAFTRSGVFKSAANDLSLVKSDYSVAIDIRDFQAEYRGTDNPVVHVRFNATVINTRTKDTITSQSYEEEVVAESNNMVPIVTAFDMAFQKTATRVIQDAAQALARR